MMNWNAAKQKSRRLAELSHIPALQDVQFLFDQAMAAKGETIELKWTHGDPKATWCLTAKRLRGGNEQPCSWALLRGDGSVPNYEWTYDSGDVAMIHTLLVAAFPTEQIAAPAMHSTGGVQRIQAHEPAATAEHARPFAGQERGDLEGDLKKMAIENLIQSITVGRMSGRLSIQSKNGQAEVFFEEGQPVHATYLGCAGNIAFVEVLTLREGEFRFFTDQTPDSRTITKNVNALLMEGAALIDYCNFLDNCELTMESYLYRNHSSITEGQFESMLANAVPVDMRTQKRLYMTIDNRSRLGDVLRTVPLERVEWAPIMFNLVSCGLVSLSNKAEQPGSTKTGSTPQFDAATVQGLLKQLVRPDSGLYTYPVLLFFLEQELARYQSMGHPFSLLILRIGIRSAVPGVTEPEALSKAALTELFQRVDRLKRKSDIVTHFQALNYAVILPCTQKQSATAFARRLIEVIMASPLVPEIDVSQLAGSVGLATMPDDGEDLGQLISCAGAPKFNIG